MSASFFTILHDYRAEYKKSIQSLAIAVISAILYIVPVIYKISKDPSNLYFWSMFGLLSLVFLDVALLTDNHSYLLGFAVAAFLASAVLCFLSSAIYFSNYLTSCNEKHISTEIVPIITTVNGEEFGESIYGDGFVVGIIYRFTPRRTIYQYHFQNADGNIESKEIPAGRTEISYIDDVVAPYLEITYTTNCMGYRNESKTHVFRGIRKTYHLYIPERGIVNITPAS